MKILNYLFRRNSKPASAPAQSKNRSQESVTGKIKGRRVYTKRPITRDVDRDLSPLKHSRQREIGQYLFRSNPVAKRGVENLTSFVTSEGFKVKATSKNDHNRKRFQRWLDAWWKRNKWDSRLGKRYKGLCVEGEAFYWPAQPDENGISKLCQILPENVRQVYRDRLDAERIYRISLSSPLEFESGEAVHVKHHLDVIDEENLEGDVLILQVNTIPGQTRGHSDLLVVADWLDQLDTLIQTEVERVQFQRAFAWFVKIVTGSLQDGGDDRTSAEILEAARKRIAEEGPPGGGCVQVCDETEEWEAKAPDLHLEDSVAFIKLVLHICFGGLYMPEHYFATGGDVNKATSSNMDTPIFAVVRDRKRDLKSFFELAINSAIKVAKRMGRFVDIPDDELIFEVVSRDPDRTAYDLIGNMLKSLGEALSLGVDRGYFEDREAAQAMRVAASGLGLGDFPHVSEEALSGARERAKRALEVQKNALSGQYPLAVGEPQVSEQQESDPADESSVGSKKNAIEYRDNLVGELNSRWGVVRSETAAARSHAVKMSRLAAQNILMLGGADIDLKAVERAVDRTKKTFRSDYPRSIISSAVESGRRYVDKAMSPFGLKVPPKMKDLGRSGSWSLARRVANSTVKPRPLSAGGSRRTFGQEVQWAAGYWASEDFGNLIIDRARDAKSRGLTLQQLAGELVSDPRLPDSLAGVTAKRVSDMAEHAQLRASRFAEDLTWQDYAEANPGRIEQRYVRVKVRSGPCGVCDPNNSKVYEVGKGPRLPRHERCGCVYYPIIDGSEPFPEHSSSIVGESALPALVGAAFEKNVFEYGVLRSPRSVSGYLESHIEEPALTVYPYEKAGRPMEEVRMEIASLPLASPKGLESIRKLDEMGNSYTKTVTGDFADFPSAMATLDSPDHVLKIGDGWLFTKRIVPGGKRRPRIFQVDVRATDTGPIIRDWRFVSTKKFNSSTGGRWYIN